MNVTHNKKINVVLFFLIILLQIFDNFFRELGLSVSGVSIIKNILPVFLLIYVPDLIGRKKENLLFSEELKWVLRFALLLLILSFYYMVKNSGMYLKTFEVLLRITYPVLVAFVILNVMTFEKIKKLMKFYLVAAFLAYLFCIVIPQFSIFNIMSISFISSSSPFESNYFSPCAIGLCIFFGYYRNDKFCMWLSVIFAIMTFKRIMVLYAIFLLLFGGKLYNDKEIPSRLINIFVVLFSILSFFYIALMGGVIQDVIYKYFGVDVLDFSMGRSYFYQAMLAGGFKSTGLYSSLYTGYQGVEMDIPQFFIELGWISVIGTVVCFSQIAKNNIYTFFIVGFCLLEMLTSHFIDIVSFWLIAYISIGCIRYKKRPFVTFRERPHHRYRITWSKIKWRAR